MENKNEMSTPIETTNASGMPMLCGQTPASTESRSQGKISEPCSTDPEGLNKDAGTTGPDEPKVMVTHGLEQYQENAVIQKNKKYIKKKDIIHVGEYNVRSMNDDVKIETLLSNMERLKVDIVGISEVRWEDPEDFWQGDYRIITTKSNNGNEGVAFVMNKSIGQRVTFYEQFSDRIIIGLIQNPRQLHL